jgi:hypothetical protein
MEARAWCGVLGYRAISKVRARSMDLMTDRPGSMISIGYVATSAPLSALRGFNDFNKLGGPNTPLIALHRFNDFNKLEPGMRTLCAFSRFNDFNKLSGSLW